MTTGRRASLLSAGLGRRSGVHITDVRAYRNGPSGIDLAPNGYRVNIAACPRKRPSPIGTPIAGGGGMGGRGAPGDSRSHVSRCVFRGSSTARASDATSISLFATASVRTGRRPVGQQDGVAHCLHLIHDTRSTGVNSVIAGPSLADPPAGVARDSYPTPTAPTTRREAYQTPPRNTLIGNHIFNTAPARRSGRPQQESAATAVAFNHVFDDQASPTQTDRLTPSLTPIHPSRPGSAGRRMSPDSWSATVDSTTRPLPPTRRVPPISRGSARTGRQIGCSPACSRGSRHTATRPALGPGMAAIPMSPRAITRVVRRPSRASARRGRPCGHAKHRPWMASSSAPPNPSATARATRSPIPAPTSRSSSSKACSHASSIRPVPGDVSLDTWEITERCRRHHQLRLATVTSVLLGNADEPRQ